MLGSGLGSVIWLIVSKDGACLSGLDGHLLEVGHPANASVRDFRKRIFRVVVDRVLDETGEVALVWNESEGAVENVSEELCPRGEEDGAFGAVSRLVVLGSSIKVLSLDGTTVEKNLLGGKVCSDEGGLLEGGVSEGEHQGRECGAGEGPESD